MIKLVKTNQKQKGFTLIEAVVSTAVFAFVISACFGVYLATIQLDSKSRTERAVQTNARFIMDYISKEIRNGSINYEAANNLSTLSLINQLDEKESISWGGIGNPVLILNKTGIGTTHLNSNDIIVTNFAVYLTPDANPYELSNHLDVQPHVTVVLQLRSLNQKAAEATTMNVQSTFSVRDYPSRQ